LTRFSLCSFVVQVNAGWKAVAHSIWDGVLTTKEGLNSPLDPLGVSCDETGLRVGPIALLRKTSLGFLPRRGEELDFIFSTIGYPVLFSRKTSSLQAIADALNNEDVSRAWFTMTYMRLPTLLDEAMRQRLLDAEALFKASADDPKHPGWPAGTPGGRGGKFRPKAEPATSASRFPESMELAARKSLRRMVRTRLLAHLKQTSELELKLKDPFEEKLEEFEDHSPLLLDDIGQMVVGAEEIKIETEVASKFVQLGPHRLEELQVAADREAFSSYKAFYKYDRLDDWLEKRFGPAGEGQQYHHIVEQGPNADSISAIQLQSTENIIRLPTLLHEEVSAVYGKAAPEAPGMTLRQWLREKPYEFQYQYGLKVLRDLAILR
jgi:hypothetical protein